MIFLISLALALALAAFCAEPLRKRPAPFYVSAVLIAAGVSVCALADVQFPLWFKAWVWPIFARGALAGALFVLVMLAGAFPNGSAGAKRLMPLRGPLSILACILTLGHNIAYGKTYFVMLFLQPWRLPLTQKLASWCSVAMIVIMLPLFVTSFPSVRRKMDGRRWKKLQRLAYLFYALLCAHILLLTIPYAISARPGYRLTVFVYTAVFVSYAVCRVQKALSKDKRAFRPHAGVVLGTFAASIVLAFTCASTAPQAAHASVAAAPVENAAPAPSAEAEASRVGNGAPSTEAIAAQPENAKQRERAPEEAAAVAEPPSEEPSAGESGASAEPESPPQSEQSPAIEPQSESVPQQQETPSVSEPEPEPQPAIEPEPVSVYRDGTYTGTGMGFEGPITVSVTIQNDRIVSVQVLSQSEDEPFWTDALVTLSRIVSAQSPDVDAVSEATSSCHGIIDAVRQALESAKR